jgi:DNA replication and repair protein RecF
MEGPDHKCSLEPEEFRELIAGVRAVEKCLGTGVKIPSQSEVNNTYGMRRSLVARNDIKAGTILTEEHFGFKRPANGLSPNYLETLIRYNKVLLQRNALLKQFNDLRIFDNESIDVWNVQLIASGKIIHQKRSAFLVEFIPIFQKYFNLISNHKEEIDISYLSQLDEDDFEAALEKSKRKDSALGYTTVGIHKDDLVFLIHHQPIKKFGSQGQQKSFLIALKLAQFEIISTVLKSKPILLLDDVFDKLDHSRVSELMKLISQHIFGQVFISDTDQDRVEKVFEGIEIERKIYRVKGGQLEEG